MPCALREMVRVAAPGHTGCDQRSGGRSATEHEPASTGRGRAREIGTPTTDDAEPLGTHYGARAPGCISVLLTRPTWEQPQPCQRPS